MLPVLHINTSKYLHNLKYLSDILHQKKISVMAVSKVFCAEQPLIDIINQTTIEYIADSKLTNLEKMHTDKKRVFLRIPQKSEALDVCKYADLSLQSELEVIKEINEKAKALQKKHHIILMFDLGDLREGIYYKSNYHEIIKEILELEFIHLEGIGTNLTCYGGVIPDLPTLDKLEYIKKDIESSFQLDLKMISGGNSSSLPLVFNQKLPSFINNLRLGEAFVLGRETAYQEPIKNMFDDIFTLEAEIVELKEKPSYPEGNLGFDAFGRKVEFEDLGIIKRAILAVGRQEVNCEHLIPPKGIRVLGCSSDHLIVEIKDGNYKVGDSMIFKLSYGGILSLMTSPYMKKVYYE